jgi:hypothetical protein
MRALPSLALLCAACPERVPIAFDPDARPRQQQLVEVDAGKLPPPDAGWVIGDVDAAPWPDGAPATGVTSTIAVTGAHLGVGWNWQAATTPDGLAFAWVDDQQQAHLTITDSDGTPRSDQVMVGAEVWQIAIASNGVDLAFLSQGVGGTRFMRVSREDGTVIQTIPWVDATGPTLAADPATGDYGVFLTVNGAIEFVRVTTAGDAAPILVDSPIEQNDGVFPGRGLTVPVGGGFARGWMDIAQDSFFVSRVDAQGAVTRPFSTPFDVDDTITLAPTADGFDVAWASGSGSADSKVNVVRWPVGAEGHAGDSATVPNEPALATDEHGNVWVVWATIAYTNGEWLSDLWLQTVDGNAAARRIAHEIPMDPYPQLLFSGGEARVAAGLTPAINQNVLTGPVEVFSVP